MTMSTLVEEIKELAESSMSDLDAKRQLTKDQKYSVKWIHKAEHSVTFLRASMPHTPDGNKARKMTTQMLKDLSKIMELVTQQQSISGP